MHDLKRLNAQARRQAGVVSRRQLLARGFSSAAVSRALLNGTMNQVHPGVYRVAGAADSEMLRLWAAILWAGPGACLSHLTAAWSIWKLEGLGRRPPQEVDLLVPHDWRLEAPRGIRLRRTSTLRSGQDTTVMNGLPCTTLARTLVDLAGVLERRVLEQAVDSAMRRGRQVGEAAVALLGRLGHRGRSGAATLVALTDARALGPSGSPLEVEVRQAIEAAGLPSPVPQLVVNDDRGDQIAVVDFAWPEHNLLLFVHSRTWHSTPNAVEKDFNQISDLSALGYTVVALTSQRFRDDRERFIEQLRARLTA